MTSTLRVLAICTVLLAAASPSIAKRHVEVTPTGPGGVGSPECLSVQLAAQAAVLAGMPYSNHGQLVSTAAHVVGNAENAGTIDSDCASCIINQFARRIPIDEQTPCGEDTRVVADLRGPEAGACDGPVVGSTSVQELPNGDIEFRLVFVSGPANTLFNVFWVGTGVANGCHNDATGYVDIGDVTTDAAGQANFVTTIVGGNPFPGDYVHIDVCVPFCSGPMFTSTYGDVFLVTPTPTMKTMAGGDPSRQTIKPEESRAWSLVKDLYR
jgi:hypothetical protein